MGQDCADFAGARDIDADLKRLALPPLGLPMLLAGEAMDDVLGDKTALLGVADDGAEVADHPLDHRRRTLVGAQPVRELTHHRHGQVGELHGADIGDDVVVEVLAIGFHGRALQPVIDVIEPLLPGCRDGHA